MKTTTPTMKPYIRILVVAGGRYVIAKTDKFELTLRMEDGESACDTIARFQHETAARIERDRTYFDKLVLLANVLEKEPAF